MTEVGVIIQYLPVDIDPVHEPDLYASMMDFAYGRAPGEAAKHGGVLAGPPQLRSEWLSGRCWLQWPMVRLDRK
jgi:hypothetical protein